MHSEEIRKALFPMEVMADKLKAENEHLSKAVENYTVEVVRYRVLRAMGVVITIEGQGAVYLQGDEMDEWFTDTPRKAGSGDTEVHAEGQAVNNNPTTPRKKK